MIERLIARGPAGAAVPASALYLLGLLAALKAAGLVLVAESIAQGIASLAGTASVPDPAGLVWTGAAGVLLRAA
ncbi:hypothetical protein, partial [Arthrobacter sp. H5]|uniref:hypothetical protein n=1 Tax=Arthrobacter sp. H5 TaxID=1267973 RepID=UPI00048307FB